jgi:CMP-N-acetylneuraminic acid synthetase
MSRGVWRRGTRVKADMAEPLITVYITNHNYGRYLRQSIESVLRQKYSDFELIILDDGSTDESAAILDLYEGNPKIRIVRQENKGLTVSNNIALRLARGKYLIRLDADDYLDENALLVMANYLEQNPNVGLVFPDYYLIDSEGGLIRLERRHNFKDGVSLYDQPAHGACTMIRRDCLQALGGYNEDFACQDGYDLWIRFIEEYNVGNINLPLFYYRQHPSSLTKNETRILETRARIKEAFLRDRPTLDVVCILPVRGTAADPQSAIFRKVGDRALLDWSIDAAREAKNVKDVVVVTSDGLVIEHVSSRYKDVRLIRRPPELSRLNTPLETTVSYGLAEWSRQTGQSADAILLLYAEAPFRGARVIDMAVNAMRLFDTDSVIAVRQETDFFYRHDGSGLMPVHGDRVLRLEREGLFRETAGMHLVKREFFETHNKVIGGRLGHIAVDTLASLVVRTPFDLWVAEQVAAARAAEQRRETLEPHDNP